MKRLVQPFVLFFAACGPALLAQSSSRQTTAAFSAKALETAAAFPPVLAATVVEYGERDVVRLKAKLRYTTLIVLPKNEQILDFTCGDKEYWIVNGTQNFAYVKPARANSQTNLNLITASGNVYSFVLSEVSSSADVEPDLKVFVQPKDGPMISALNGAPKFVSAAQLEDYRQQIEMAKEETRQTKNTAQSTIDREVTKFRGDYPTGLKFVYRFERDQKPFLVDAIYHDDKFTYIRANPQETPALYEIKDGKPNLINFEYRNGTYIVSKILDSGYLSIGKARMNFVRQE
jgi:type IV secretory pathway VirB9-like protein